MSDLTQFGQHPDADQLTAFVEHALPPHEREQTLAHLASCEHCRAIVALSLPPIEESPAPQPTPTRRPWFASWHLAWPAAAAFAVLAFIIHLRNTMPNQQTVAAPSEIATSRPPTAFSAPQPSPAATPKPLSEPAAKTPPPNKPVIRGSRVPSHEKNIPDIPIANRSYTAFNTSRASSTTGANNQGADNLSTVPQIQAANAAPRTLPSAAAPAPPAPAAPTQPVGGIVGGVVNGSAADANAAAATLRVKGRNIAPFASLPSRQPALSSAVNGHKVLAIDAQNTLFYSEDDGIHWTTIPTQWRGRAVQVNLARPAVSLPQNATIATASTFEAVGGPIPSSAPAINSVRTGTITGTITDPSGATVRGTSITLTNTTARTSRTVTSDSNGHYLADNLIPGHYQLEATATGFQKQQLAVNVAPSQQNQADLTLNVGSVSETVTVEAAPVAPIATTSESPATPGTTFKKSAPAAPAKPAATPVFEITTDNGGHWTSPDGKIWTQK